MPNPKEVSTLSKWLEQRLKEYFARKIKRNHLAEQEDYHWVNSLPKKNNGAPIEAAVFDFRILDLKLEREDTKRNYGIPRDDTASDENQTKFASSASDEEPYKQRNSYVHLVYQKGSHSVGKELHLSMLAAQIENMSTNPNEPTLKSTSHSTYILSLDEHQIDVYTKVFPVLQDWALSQKVIVNLSVPECYYGCYQTESGKNATPEIPDGYVFLDDIMSKAAAGLELFQMEKKQAEANPNKKQSSYRLLILDDVEYAGFKQRITQNSHFLSLLNVEEALKGLAEIHSVSWSFARINAESLEKVFPFLESPLYLPYVAESVMRGFPVMVGTVRDYLLRHNTPENEVRRVLQSLIELKTKVASVVEWSCNPKTVKCLVHQDACGARFLFRYSLLDHQRLFKGRKERVSGAQENTDNANTTTSSASFPGETFEQDVELGLGTKARRDCLEKGLKREVVIINWQTASVGSPMLDVAFLLMTSLPPRTRRVETSSLLKIYWNTFRMHAGKFGINLEWSDKELYQEFLEALLYTCVLVTGNVDVESMCKLDDGGIETFVECIKDLMDVGLI